MQLNMVSGPEVSSSNTGGHVNYIIAAHSNIHVCGLGELARAGGVLEYNNISELPTFPH
jgi:hypothetical protein